MTLDREPCSFVGLLTTLTLTLLAFGCDLKKTAEQLTASHVLVGTLGTLPTVEIAPAAMAGLDAGVALPDAGAVSVPGVTSAYVFFGEREPGLLSQAPRGVDGATVELEAEGELATRLQAAGAGTYTRSGAGAEGPRYVSGTTLRFIARNAGEEYVGAVEETPTAERIDALHPPQGFVSQPAGRALVVRRPAASEGNERPVAFITVVPVTASGEKGEPTWTNVPKKPLEFLELVAAPGAWKAAEVTLPPEAFPYPGRVYLVIVQAMRLGGPTTANLFTGSAVLAGAADVGVVRTDD